MPRRYNSAIAAATDLAARLRPFRELLVRRQFADDPALLAGLLLAREPDELGIDPLVRAECGNIAELVVELAE